MGESFPSLPSPPLCYFSFVMTRGGSEVVPFSLSLFHIVPWFVTSTHAPMSPLPTPLLPASKIGYPTPRASGGHEDKTKNGPMPHPFLLPPGLSSFSAASELQPCCSPSALASLNSKLLPAPFHLPRCHSFPDLVTSSLLGSVWSREKCKGFGVLRTWCKPQLC